MYTMTPQPCARPALALEDLGRDVSRGIQGLALDLLGLRDRARRLASPKLSREQRRARRGGAVVAAASSGSRRRRTGGGNLTAKGSTSRPRGRGLKRTPAHAKPKSASLMSKSLNGDLSSRFSGLRSRCTMPS